MEGPAVSAIHFEDLRPGAVTTYGAKAVTADEITAFARAYDAQPFHLGEDSARDTFVGRLIASGWHTLAMQMRMLCDAWLLRAAGMGSPGIEEAAWLKPVLPGDVLRVRQTILEARASATKPWMGVVRFRFETLNAADEIVMRQTNPIMFLRRDGPEPPVPAAREPASGPGLDASRPASEEDGSGMMRGFEALEVGATDILGEHSFTAEEIVRFATAFDPQPFHVDEAAAARSHFGRLAASGWHNAAWWMHHLVARRTEAAAAARASGLPVPRFGPSPGIRDLRWLHPVHAGDTIRYATTLVEKRLSGSRPGWGLTVSRNTGWNQHGAKVLEFSGSGFMGLSDAPR